MKKPSRISPFSRTGWIVNSCSAKEGKKKSSLGSGGGRVKKDGEARRGHRRYFQHQKRSLGTIQGKIKSGAANKD